MTDPTTVAFFEIDATLYGALFSEWRESAAHSAATSEFRDEPGTRYFVNGWAGYAVRLDGELVLVHSHVSGMGDALMRSALANGATYLDCFDGYLPTFYARHGFVDLQHVPNWTPGEADVVLMALPGYASRHGLPEAV